MAIPRAFAFVPFNEGSPLNLAQHNDIPLAALKGLPDFNGEGQTIAFEHIRDIASLCNVHHVTRECSNQIIGCIFQREGIRMVSKLASCFNQYMG